MTQRHGVSFTCFLNNLSTCCDLLVQTGPGRSSSLVDPHSFTGAMVMYLQFMHALAVAAVFPVSCGLGAVCRIGNSPLISGCNQHCVSGSRHLHQLLQCQRSSEAAVAAGQLSVFTAEICDITTTSVVCWMVCLSCVFLARCYVAAAPWLASARCSSSPGDCVYQLRSRWASSPQDVPRLSLICRRFRPP